MSNDIVIDGSVLLSILLGEPDAERLAERLAACPHRWISAVSYLEVSTVISVRKGRGGLLDLNTLLERLRLEVIPFTQEQGDLAREALENFATGRNTAALTLGECCAYALSRYSGYPLLYAGERFLHTDVDTVG